MCFITSISIPLCIAPYVDIAKRCWFCLHFFLLDVGVDVVVVFFIIVLLLLVWLRGKRALILLLAFRV